MAMAASPSTAASSGTADARGAGDPPTAADLPAVGGVPMETDDAVGSAAAGVPPPRQVQLLELPDELLSLITAAA